MMNLIQKKEKIYMLYPKLNLHLHIFFFLIDEEDYISLHIHKI